MPRLDIRKPIGVMKIENKRCPETDPCGTPVLCVIVLDLLAAMNTNLLNDSC